MHIDCVEPTAYVLRCNSLVGGVRRIARGCASTEERGINRMERKIKRRTNKECNAHVKLRWWLNRCVGNDRVDEICDVLDSRAGLGGSFDLRR